MYRMMQKDKEKEKEKALEQALNPEDLSNIKNGVCALLRDTLIKAHRDYTRVGYLEISDKDNIDRLYESYSKLGGNGTITTLYHQMAELPLDVKEDV